MSYIVTGRSVDRCHALPRPVTVGPEPEPAIAVPPAVRIAGVIGHVSGPLFDELGSSDMKSTATSPAGSPELGTDGHEVAAVPGCAMRPNCVTLYDCDPRATVMFTAFGQL